MNEIPMKVTLINTSDTGGGAPVACRRLMYALNSSSIDAKMLVQQKKSKLDSVNEVLSGPSGKLTASANFFRERLPFMFFHERDSSVRFAFSEANTGTDISKQSAIKEADILHLHWTNRGYLSIEHLKKILSLNKPVVWTLHDMWAFTGGCHYTGGCDHFLEQCGACPILRNPKENDLSRQVWRRKADLFTNVENLNIVTCSNWLAEEAGKSALLNQFPIQTIPNPIDTSVYKGREKRSARAKWNIDQDARVLLFGAANINDTRKGLAYLLQALDLLHTASEFPVELVLFGKNKSFDASDLPYKVHILPLINSEEDLIDLYSLADVFVHSSLEDNLPNMVMESMACSTPVVAFNTGGLSDLIDHQINGYLAEYRSAEDFSAGIKWILKSSPEELGQKARQKVEFNFTPKRVASKYEALYRSILEKHV